MGKSYVKQLEQDCRRAFTKGEFMKMLLLLSLLVSCAHKDVGTFTVAVDSISAPEASGKTFTIISGDKSIPNNDLRFQQFAGMVENALKLDGFVPVTKKPDVRILLTYGIGDPVYYTETSSVPVYGSSNSQVSNAWGQNVGSVQTWGHNGFRTSSTQHTKYKRTIVLRAVSAKTGAPVWETVITSSGWSDDLARAFPYMLYAGTGRYGKSKKGKQRVDEDNAHAIALRN